MILAKLQSRPPVALLGTDGTGVAADQLKAKVDLLGAVKVVTDSPVISGGIQALESIQAGLGSIIIGVVPLRAPYLSGSVALALVDAGTRDC